VFPLKVGILNGERKYIKEFCQGYEPGWGLIAMSDVEGGADGKRSDRMWVPVMSITDVMGGLWDVGAVWQSRGVKSTANY
jgi:hypothetical protein